MTVYEIILLIFVGGLLGLIGLIQMALVAENKALKNKLKKHAKRNYYKEFNEKKSIELLDLTGGKP